MQAIRSVAMIGAWAAALMLSMSCTREYQGSSEGAGVQFHPVNQAPTVECTRCHERPTTQNGHFAPTACSDCHQTLGAVPHFVFNHQNTAGNFGTTCLPCHTSNRPPLNQVFGTSYGDFAHGDGGHPSEDCSRCHSQPGVTWVISNPETVCASCH